MRHVFQVGVGSGGMPVLDAVAQHPSVGRVTIVEPDRYLPHNVERHLFGKDSVGELKANAAVAWLRARRADVRVDAIVADIMDSRFESEIDAAIRDCSVGICAVDNEPAKYHFDMLMRRHAKPWTLGEVLSGGIGGFVHVFFPGGPCYGCVASHLKRSIEVEAPRTPDYSQPSAPVEAARVPASKSSIIAVAGLHAALTENLLENPGDFDPGFTTLLLTLRRVPDVFPEAFRPHRMKIARSNECLICRTPEREIAAEDLDVALHEALERLAHE